MSIYFKGNKVGNTFAVGTKPTQTKTATPTTSQINAHDFEEESGLKPILGIRGGESISRKSKYQSCLNKKGTFTPLWDMSDDIMNEIYKRYNIEIPEVYNHICRTGCMGCPYGTWKHDTEKELKLITPAQRKFVKEYFKESYNVLGVDVEKIEKELEQNNSN